MSRRSTPERLHQARRAGTRTRLIGCGMSAELAERWIEAWEPQLAAQELAHDGAFWDASWAWIHEQRATRKLPG